MNTPTPSQLADIGAKAACEVLPQSTAVVINPRSQYYADEAPAREAFAKAVLDAVGYKFPVDPEREAFDAWIAANPSRSSNDDLFEAWKAGRVALLSPIRENKFEKPEADPPWIEWKGGKCPIPDTVKRWEFRSKDGTQSGDCGPPSVYNWGYDYEGTIVAYRVLDWGTAKSQPETFEAHGHTWFKHTPGDPMPVAGDVEVCIVCGDGDFTSGASPASAFTWNRIPDCLAAEVTGWRYADS